MVVITIAVLMTMVMTLIVIVSDDQFCTNVSIIIQLAHHSSGILVSVSLEDIYCMSHKGNGETDFLMSGQLFILTHSFTLLAYSIIHSLNHTFTRTFIKLMMMMMMMMILLMSTITLIGMVMSMSMMSGVRQLKCVNLSVYNNLSICVCMDVSSINQTSSDLE